MSEKWQTKNISLAYWMGEVCLFRKSFSLQATNVDFQNYRPEQGTQSPQSIDDETDGYMLYSVPLGAGHQTIWTEKNYIHYISQSFRRYIIDLDLGYEAYLGGFSSKTRSTLRRKIRKFAKESGGTIDWRTYSSADEITEFHRIARSISKETYQEKLLNAGLPEDGAFCADMVDLAKNNNVRGYLLYLDGKAVSYLYTPIEEGRFIYAFLGYLPEVSKYSPGTVLLFKVLEHLFESGEGNFFDFTEGQSDQKKQFSTSNIYCGNMICLKSSMTNYFWLWLHRIVNTVSTGLGRVLERLGLKKIIKKLLRR